LLLGRDDPVKGHGFAIKVSEKVRQTIPDLKVTMSGPTSSPFPWLKTKGWVSDEEKLRLLQTASLLIVPSAFEGEPMVVLEAISCGLPVLTSDRVHSLPPSVKVAPFEDEEAWASQIILMLQKPTDSHVLRGHSEKYKISVISNHWKTIYHDLIAE
jgi:glycosyltransferase involved in cell wall biosynthesis